MMKPIKAGGLYQIKKFDWLIYPSRDIAVELDSTFAAVAVHGSAAYWSKRLNCNVSYISPNSMFVLLEENGKYCKVLSTEGMVGWIILAEWYKRDIEEVKAE